MSKQIGDLTSPDSWDEIWVNYRSPAEASVVRRRMRMQREWEGLLTNLLNFSNAGDSVLELGCAPGAMLRLLHALRPERAYRGIDYAPQGLKVARQQLATAGIEADLSLGDIRTVKADPADLVVSFGLIEHFDDPGEVLGFHRRLARPGGHVAVTVPHYAHPTVVRLLRRFSPATLATHNLDIMSPPAMAEAMTSAGLIDVRSGHAGPASIPSSRVRMDAAGRAFGYAARGWNLGTEILPASWPWANHVWGVGRNGG